jgi:Holliday junction resolvase
MTNPKGTAFERPVADYLAREIGDDAIDRQIRAGAADKGDVRGIKAHGFPVVIECKNVSRTNLAGWVGEAEIERGNADAIAGLVVHKRRGKGVKNMGEQYVTMTLADLVAILTGRRPEA